jgi:integrase
MGSKKERPMKVAQKKAHIKHEGIQETTAHRYRQSLARFFEFVRLHERLLPRTFEELDDEVGEFINYLYQDDLPQGWGIDLLSALKRFYPKCRRHLGTGHLYMKNWTRVTTRRRAIPATRDLVIGMTVAALFEGKVRLAFGILISFIGLLRVGEIVGATRRQFGLFGGGSLLTLALPESKGAKRKGTAEQITVYDPLVLKLAAFVLESLDPNEKVLDLTYYKFAGEISRLGRMYGMTSSRFTPYCLRRGGATWHFTKYASYDATQHLGRWAQSKTAKQYIDQATAETTELELPAWGLRRVKIAVANFQTEAVATEKNRDVGPGITGGPQRRSPGLSPRPP